MKNVEVTKTNVWLCTRTIRYRVGLEKPFTKGMGYEPLDNEPRPGRTFRDNQGARHYITEDLLHVNFKKLYFVGNINDIKEESTRPAKTKGKKKKSFIATMRVNSNGYITVAKVKAIDEEDAMRIATKRGLPGSSIRIQPTWK